MCSTNAIQVLINDIGGVISTLSETAAGPMDKVFVFLVSMNLVLWFFLPFLLLLFLWQFISTARSLRRMSDSVVKLTAVMNDTARDQTQAIHHLRDRTGTAIEGLTAAFEKGREKDQQNARDITTSVERLQSHVRAGSDDIAKQLANIYDRIGKALSLDPSKPFEEVPEDEKDNP